jgi:tetratricopeptide (TPR) repeat protein
MITDTSTPADFRATVDSYGTELLECDCATLRERCNDPRLATLNRVLAASMLSSLDRSQGRETLLKLVQQTPSNDPRLMLIGLDGLRHLVDLDEWLRLVTDLGASWLTGDQMSRAMAKLWMRATGVGMDALRACEFEPWFDSGLFGTLPEFMHRAVVRGSTGRLRQAIDAARLATRWYPQDPAGFSMLAALLIRIEDYRGAIAAATEVLARDPQHKKALNFRSFALLQTREYQLALKDLDECVRLEPEDQATRANRAHCYAALRRFAEAAADEQELGRLEAMGHQHTSATSDFESVPQTGDAIDELRITENTFTQAFGVLHFLKLVNVVPQVLYDYLVDDKIPLRAAELVIRALNAHGMKNTLDESLIDTRLRSDIRAIAACTILQDERERAIEPSPPRFQSALAVLQAMTVQPNEASLAREIAARGLAAVLVAPSLAEVMRGISDAGISPATDRPEFGVRIVISLARGIERQRRFDVLKSLATDVALDPALREICGELYGSYNRVGAVRILKELRAAPALQPMLIRLIDKYVQGGN